MGLIMMTKELAVKTSYNTVEEMYKDVNELVRYARTKLNNPDFATDCVHEALIPAIKYANVHPHAKVRRFFVLKQIERAAERYNQQDSFISLSENYDPSSASKRGRRISSSDMDLSE